ncbi:zinc finger protein 37 homolog isoform X2 [Leguminivora glycinivorella]|uniref:zinc finger protein 37 homolog isoform X2 n=1 Tax=Leguminivora glycinivorella TaxID=1035111 RepID=UPI00200F8AFC|nr:zinc finger protein 37 homolog isoform X2 [Leguminivora glycinivorella]
MSVQKSNGPIIDPALCRCCRAIKKCRILTAEYNWMGKKEVYADMVMDCYGILLSHVDDNEKDSGVCATCVVRLREAIAFRQQVLQCEELFLQAKLAPPEEDTNTITNYENKLKKLELENIELKTEPKDYNSDHNSIGDDRDDALPTYSDDEDNKPLKPESKPGDLPKDSEVKSEDSEDFNGSSSDSDEPIKKKAKRKKKANGKEKKKTAKKQKAGTSSKKAPKVMKKPPIEKKNTYDRDLDCMSEENLLTIIEYSYVCPFKNRRNNYYCFYCKDYYAKPEDLRAHTVSHDTKPFQLLMGYKKMPKIDITRIDCRLCSTKIDDLNTFKQHIDQIHGKKIYFEAPDKMLLYRLTWNDLVCVMCSDVFEDFNALNTHMVEHFSNFTCDICGMCFLEKPRLDAHLKRHKDDERHTCEVCGKVFKSNHYKDMHVDIVHKKKAIIRCPRCDECFMSYALKNKHLTEAHGQKRTYPCNLCDKIYNRQKTLTEHQRRNHQKVLKHQCEYCDQRFYLPSRLKEHMATHTGERNFRCEYCDKSYPRLKSLQYHIRTHTNDRRYRCHICGQAFIQNASLKSHIKSHHPECDIEQCYF